MVTLAMVTYLDRACIGAMAPKSPRSSTSTPAQMSWVFFAFILAYAIFEIPTARWADRRGANRAHAHRELVVRVHDATAGAWNYASLLVTRFLFGAGEAGAFPCMARVMSRWIPLRERGTAKGIFFAGAYASGAVTTAPVTPLLPLFDWRTILRGVRLRGFRVGGGLAPLVPRRAHRTSRRQRGRARADPRRPPADAPHPRGWRSGATC